ncbi:MAG: family N-acetyltransferase [Rhodospirillales bacterium]|nr:family N-acetyltransferase [Rhodospirillales bacterium]
MTIKPPDIDIRPVKNFAALASIWLDLERRAAGSFFQSWAWTGCMAEARFADPWLLTAWRNGEIVGLALFNRGPRERLGLSRPLLLGESGKPGLDEVFIEHNGLLLDRSAGDELARSCWAALGSRGEGGFRSTKWILSGVAQAALAALPGDRRMRVAARRPAPYLDLAVLAADVPAIDQLSANTRQQIRRSLRAWEEIGPLRLEIAATHGAADAFLDALKDLHQRYWVSRGKPGAFAEPFFGHFHHGLIRRPSDAQSVDLIRVSAGEQTVGYLYNLVHDGWVAAYQSGFDFRPNADRLRPGLVCHLMAIEHYRRAGAHRYDFLGGEARYKRSFANAETELLWLEGRRKLPWHFGRSAVSSS